MESLKWILGSLLGLLIAVIGYWGQRNDHKLDDHEDRLQDLESQRDVLVARLDSMDRKLDMLLEKGLNRG